MSVGVIWLSLASAAELRVPTVDQLHVRAEPDRTAALVGELVRGEPVEVAERTEGPDCPDEGWGRLVDGGWACLDHTAPTADWPRELPALGDDQILPFLYVRARKGPLALPHGTETERTPYEASTFRGRDLLVDPLPEGAHLAWVLGDGPPEELVLDGLPPDQPLRLWVPAAERPEGVADDEIWLDIRLTQATLAVYRGDVPEYVTLVSPGVGGRHRTPTGTFRVQDKAAWSDMASRPGADDPYHVEAVPWIVHFKPRYALHAAYWHERFGTAVSHGCVNLSPLDAAEVFERVEPELPLGWHTVYADDGGTLIRIQP